MGNCAFSEYLEQLSPNKLVFRHGSPAYHADCRAPVYTGLHQLPTYWDDPLPRELRPKGSAKAADQQLHLGRGGEGQQTDCIVLTGKQFKYDACWIHIMSLKRCFLNQVKALLSTGLNRPRKGTDAGDHPPITPMRAASEAELGESYN